MMKSKSQTRREKSPERITDKKSATKKGSPLRRYTFGNGVKIDAKNYADALDKRNKMIKSPPMSKAIGDEE